MGRADTLTQVERRRREVELMTIAALQYRPADTASLLTRIQPGDFADEEHQDFWSRAQATFEEFGRVSLALVSGAKGGLTAVTGGAEAMRAAVQSPMCPDILEMFRAACAVSDMHRMMSEGREALAGLEAAHAPVRDFADGFAHQVQHAASQVAPEAAKRSAAELAFESLANLEASWEATYGIRALDRATAGLRPGTFHVVIASTGHGKSSLALTAALATGRLGLKVLYVTQEMTDEECSRRWASMVTGLTERELRAKMSAGDLDYADLQARIPDRISARHDLPTPAAIAAEVHRAEVDGDPYHLVVVDYIQQYLGEGKSLVERIDSAVATLKSMALNRKVAVLAPAQMNRENDDAGIPHRNNIRGSGSIEQWADVVVGLRKTGLFYDERGGPATRGVDRFAAVQMQLAVRKARNASECVLWGDDERMDDPDISETLKMGLGTFLIYDTKFAPYSPLPEAVAERDIRGQGFHMETIE